MGVAGTVGCKVQVSLVCVVSVVAWHAGMGILGGTGDDGGAQS